MNDSYSDSIKQSISYVPLHYNEPVTLKEPAAESGYSVYHFCRLFKRRRIGKKALEIAHIELPFSEGRKVGNSLPYDCTKSDARGNSWDMLMAKADGLSFNSPFLRKC